MSFRSQRWLAVSLLMLVGFVFGAAPVRADNPVTPPRSGQVGFGISGSFGTFLPTGELGNEFGSGPGLSVRLRYRMRFERAIGLTFDAEKMNSRSPSQAAGAFDSLADSPGVFRDYMKMITAGFEFYQMFDTRERTVKYLSAGVGLAQITAHLTDGETQYPIAGDALFVSVGAGFERFFFRSWAWDMNFKYKPVLHDGKVNHDLQAQLGLMFYAGY
jgi:hypothetical protein